MSQGWITVALLLGLVHAGHCAAMCGPFALRAGSGARPLAGALAYLLGKTATYLFMGALAGAAGASAFALGDGARQILGWAVGAALVVAGVRRLVASPGSGWLAARLGPPVARLGHLARELGAGRPVAGPLILGAATGALPCGVVYLAVLQALALGDPARGALCMGCFGAGTAPALLAVALVGNTARGRLPAGSVRYAGGAAVLLAGLLTLWRAGLPGVSGACPACFS